MSETPDCYKCQYRKESGFDAHSSCHHPDFDSVHNDSRLKLMAMLGVPTNIQSNKTRVRGNPHGIRNNWFNHPINFDPVWLVECNGFKPKEP